MNKMSVMTPPCLSSKYELLSRQIEVTSSPLPCPNLTQTETVFGLLERGALPAQPQPGGLPQDAPHTVGLHSQGVTEESLGEGRPQ